MKYFKYIVVILAVFVASCDVNDVEPLDAVGEETVFTTPSTIELAMNGVYDAAQSGFYGGDETNNRGYIFGAAHVEQNDMRGEDMLLINIFYAFTYQATYSPTTANNVAYWENGFRLINVANLFMDGIPGAVESEIIDEDAGNAYIAEARLLRAMAYHEMLIMFARPYLDGSGAEPGLPIREVGINGPEAVEEQVGVSRSSVADVYEFILEDLDFAEQNLPESREAEMNVTRATKGAAIALKTRVFLHMGDWGKVIEEGDKLVSESAPFSSPINGYELTESVEGPWADNLSSESIFSMGMGPNDNLNVNAALANMYGTSAEGARGEVAISPIIWNSEFWHEDDLRREMTAGGASGRLFTTKYRDYVNNTDYAPIIRYAEVLLNVAEAEARAGDQSRALALLNAVRDRAIAGSMNTYLSLSGDNLMQAILDERRIEFLAEGMRWKDIHRNALDAKFSTGGIPAKMLSADVDGSSYQIGSTNLSTAVNAIPYDDHRFLWPLPSSEITSNPTLAQEQNPGY